jgi:hypothetical protein
LSIVSDTKEIVHQTIKLPVIIHQSANIKLPLSGLRAKNLLGFFKNIVVFGTFQVHSLLRSPHKFRLVDERFPLFVTLQ